MTDVHISITFQLNLSALKYNPYENTGRSTVNCCGDARSWSRFPQQEARIAVTHHTRAGRTLLFPVIWSCSLTWQICRAQEAPTGIWIQFLDYCWVVFITIRIDTTFWCTGFVCQGFGSGRLQGWLLWEVAWSFPHVQRSQCSQLHDRPASGQVWAHQWQW